MFFTFVENQGSAVVNFVGVFPYICLGVVKLPKFGVGKILFPAVNTRLFALAVGGIGNTCTSRDLSAENVTAAEQHEIALF